MFDVCSVNKPGLMEMCWQKSFDHYLFLGCHRCKKKKKKKYLLATNDNLTLGNSL